MQNIEMFASDYVNCSIFAYGQTGSGKSHTLLGRQNLHPENKQNTIRNVNKTELSSNSLLDFVVFWKCDFQTIVQTAALSTNPLWDFVVFGNYDFHTVSVHSGDFNQFPRWGEKGLWCFRIVISTPFSTQRSFQPNS